MVLIDFTSYDDIRASLGVSSDEIEDATLALPLYELNLGSELEDISLTLIGDYLVLKGSDPTGWSADETRFVQLAQLFSTYAVAKQLLSSLPLFSPKEQSDGKATLVRFALDPYKPVIQAVEAEYAKFLAKLKAAYGVITAITATPLPVLLYALAAVPARDPVTGT